ncbi:type II secretion system F family protein [Candidatus Pacearchaeota archaeon]|nr:type II secretion system F family protein [Candidatus Pacearchaeota archaeon]
MKHKKIIHHGEHHGEKKTETKQVHHKEHHKDFQHKDIHKEHHQEVHKKVIETKHIQHKDIHKEHHKDFQKEKTSSAGEIFSKKPEPQELFIDIKKEDVVYPKEEKKKLNWKYLLLFVLAVLIWEGVFYFTKNLLNIGAAFILMFGLFEFYEFVKKKLKISEDIKKMEEVFPDFISLMASNLRAGMTIDQAMLLSSREEFAPLDKQIVRVGKDIVTGKKVNLALSDMAVRINSEKIKKIIMLITSGMGAGGNLSVLLEETATNMRERNFVEKRAASNVLMYVIFIFFAVAFGAPLLFGLSSVLVEILTNMLSSLPSDGMNVSLPFTLTNVTISLNFVVYFSILFMVVTDILASFVLGLVNKGEEKEGVKFIIPMIAIGLVIYFISRVILLRYFSGVFG